MKVEEAGDEMEAQPKRRGRKANSKIKVEEPEDEIEEPEDPIEEQPKRNGRKRVPRLKMEDSEDAIEEEPKPKKRSRKTKAKIEDEVDGTLAESGGMNVEDERPAIANGEENLAESAPASADEEMAKPKGRKKASKGASKASKVEKAPSGEVGSARDRHNRFR